MRRKKDRQDLLLLKLKMINVQKNFLNQDDFTKLEKLILDKNFNYHIALKNEICLFYHVFYFDKIAKSPFTHFLKPLRDKVKNKILNASLVVVPKTNKKINYTIKSDLIIKDIWKAVLFLNTNNGVLNIYDNEEILPEENKFCFYDANLHTSNFTCTDQNIKSYIYLDFEGSV